MLTQPAVDGAASFAELQLRIYWDGGAELQLRIYCHRWGVGWGHRVDEMQYKDKLSQLGYE